jgi:glucoamylase
MWAHSEYVKLLRSILDKRIFDIIDPVEERYAKSRKKRRFIEVWKPNRQVQRVPAPCLLRVVAYTPFRLHWSTDEWAATHDTASEATSIGIYFADIEVVPGQRAPVRFTFYWVNEDHWEGTDYAVAVTAEGGKAAGA